MILHLDADSFFASCAQALDPRLKDKPVVTGGERSIATSVSYAAKDLGIKRGMPVWEVKRKYPQVAVIDSDYRSYSLFSKKMFAILRRFSPVVEEYSIDEGFADLTGLRRPLKLGYREIGKSVQQEIKKELDISVSVGIAPTKVLAKVASGWDKPDGLVLIKRSAIPEFLADVKVEVVWGIGPQTTAFLQKNGIVTAQQLIRRSEGWVKNNLTKPHIETWRELKGEQVYPVNPEEKTEYKSISKTRTFYTPSNDRSFLLSQLSRNLEKACAKARRYNLAAKKVVVFLKQHGFGGYYKKYLMDGEFNRPTNLPNEMLPLVREMLDKLYRKDFKYRATGVILAELQDDRKTQISLFEDPLKFEKLEDLYGSVDEIQDNFGSGTVYLGTSFESNKKASSFTHKPQFLTYSVLREGYAV